MQTLSASNAKREFGEMLLSIQKSPISVTRNGKPIAVVLSDSDYKQLKLQALQAALIEGESSGDVVNFSMQDIKNQLNNEAL
jgi:antitoxin Phd